jgi:hypothetical protein
MQIKKHYNINVGKFFKSDMVEESSEGHQKSKRKRDRNHNDKSRKE